MDLKGFYADATTVFEALGVCIIIVGILLAFAFCIVTIARGKGGTAAITVLRNVLGGGILLGLEVFVAADLIRTITEAPTVENALSLLIIVLVRTLLSWTIQIEIEGALPWKRALLQSGAVVAANGISTAIK